MTRKVPAMNHKELTFHSEMMQGGAVLADLEFHLGRREWPEARDYARELQAAAKASKVKRFLGMPCGHDGHGRLRHTANGVCCECVKEHSKKRVSQRREEREQRKLAAMASR